MKPIKLTMKGLNSFLDAQSIDFEALTQYGLFGVFGPTGSGKSSILDGMTLALYGKTSRESSNFINVQSDRMQVSFEFAVNKVNYNIIRTYRRTPQGSINATKPTKLEQFKNGEWLILEEQTKHVDKKIFEIIGLEFKDFIRTVVLPQGKFSEFIQLKGKDRREMLERLFALSKYGDELSKKLSKAMRAEKDNSLEIAGELKGYEEVTPDKKKALEEALETVTLSYVEEEKQLKTLKETQKSMENTFSLCKNLMETQQQYKKLTDQAEEIKLKQESFDQGQKILRVMPYFEQMKLTKKSYEETLVRFHDSMKAFEVVDDKLKNDKDVFEASSKNYHQFMNGYEVKKLELENQVKLIEQLISDNKEYTQKNEELKNQEKNRDAFEESLKVTVIQLEDLKQLVKKTEEEMNALVVSSEEQQLIDKGYSLEEGIKTLKKDQASHIKAIEELKVDEHQSELDVFNNKLKKLKEHERTPLSEVDYTSERQQLLSKKEQYFKAIKDKEESHKKECVLKKSLDQVVVQKKDHQVVLDDYLEKKEKNIIQSIKSTLHQGDDCPICGHTIDHLSYHTQAFIEDASIEKKMQAFQVEEETLKAKILDMQEVINDYNKTIELQVYDEKALPALEKVYNEGKQYMTDLQSLNQSIEKKQESLKLIKGQKELETSRLREVEKMLLTSEKDFLVIKKDFTEDSFKVLKDNLYKKNAAYQAQKKVVDEERLKEGELLKIIDTTKVSIEKTNRSVSLLEQSLENLSKSIEASKGKVDINKDYKTPLKTLTEDKVKIEQEYKSLENAFKKLEEQHQSCLLEYNRLSALKTSSESSFKSSEEVLNHKLSEEVLLYESLMTHAWTIEKLEQTRQALDGYHKEVHRLNLSVQNYRDQLKGESVTEDMMIMHKSKINEAENKYETTKKEKIKLERDLESLNKQFVEMKDLLEKQAAIDYQMSLLKDLESLFKGKKFVEFVASYQLRYISVEASKRLFDITSGKYGLEVDDHGQFLIRDYSHGGQVRDTSTLSGGESFLVSLSLALSLSSQIQLKGKAPLELFFLDEGFGTLDDHFLELVMSSLEKIHHDKLSIGLISHVESIKNRVPIKLDVTPSVAGVRGSRVKIEKS